MRHYLEIDRIADVEALVAIEVNVSLEAGQLADRFLDGAMPQNPAVVAPPEKLPCRSEQSPETGVVQGDEIEALVVGGDATGGLETAQVELVADNQRMTVQFLPLAALGLLSPARRKM